MSHIGPTAGKRESKGEKPEIKNAAGEWLQRLIATGRLRLVAEMAGEKKHRGAGLGCTAVMLVDYVRIFERAP